jgi:hypothetical protein
MTSKPASRRHSTRTARTRRNDDDSTTRTIESTADSETAAVHDPRVYNRCGHDDAMAVQPKDMRMKAA